MLKYSSATVNVSKYKRLTKKLHLDQRAAVGVVWVEQRNSTTTIHPVVWVKSVNSFFYESSCGSGTIAASAITGSSNIIQPTGQTIQAEISQDSISLDSDMEIIR